MSDFTWRPDFTLPQTVEFSTLESEMETGIKQYRQRWPSAKHSWKLVFKNIPLATALLIQAFFELKKGKATAFTWTNPIDGVEYTVRFATDKFTLDYDSYQMCNLDIDIQEDVA